MLVKDNIKKITPFFTTELKGSPQQILEYARVYLKGYIKGMGEANCVEFGKEFVFHLVKAYWNNFYFSQQTEFELPDLITSLNFDKVNSAHISLAEFFGNTAAKISFLEAGYLIGQIYTASIPDSIRSKNGIYFTPPSLTNRLLNLAELNGMNWESSTILDPACGGGAFLSPTAIKIISTLNENDPNKVLDHIETHLAGFEFDSFSGWLSQVFLEVAVHKIVKTAKRRLKPIIEIVDTLSLKPTRKYDLVIGNPPYGKIKLTQEIKSNYSQSLYGHPNLYGLFTHQAINFVKEGGVIAFLTPTSFLAGEYFKNLRALLLKTTRPSNFDFVIFRKGVFEDVLQETLLATYKRSDLSSEGVQVNEIHPQPNSSLAVTNLGNFTLPTESRLPWLLPRNTNQVKCVASLNKMNHFLRDWGYEVKTGPLVWNRHKNQLKKINGSRRKPIIWAESIKPSGKFKWTFDKINHEPFLDVRPGDSWLLTSYPCILLQRTTSKEQNKRLIAATLSPTFLKKYNSVVIENHINIFKPITKKPLVSITRLHLFLNSKAADYAFRCINGSVAVSAYELENMPLPSPAEINSIGLRRKTKDYAFNLEREFLNLYNIDEPI